MTTLETAESTTEPRMPALQRPMTSSMTKDGRNRSVKRGGEASGGTDWGHEAKFFAGDLELASKSEAMPLQSEEKDFRSKRFTRANSERSTDEFSDAVRNGMNPLKI